MAILLLSWLSLLGVSRTLLRKKRRGVHRSGEESGDSMSSRLLVSYLPANSFLSVVSNLSLHPSFRSAPFSMPLLFSSSPLSPLSFLSFLQYRISMFIFVSLCLIFLHLPWSMERNSRGSPERGRTCVPSSESQGSKFLA